MTARELDIDAAAVKLRHMRQLLDILERHATVTADQLIRDDETRLVIERILTQLVNLAVGINTQIAAALGGQAPPDYFRSFALAASTGAFTEELADMLAPSTSLRNVLEHEYVKVNFEIVAASIPTALDLYGQYVQQVARFLESTAR